MRTAYSFYVLALIVVYGAIWSMPLLAHPQPGVPNTPDQPRDVLPDDKQSCEKKWVSWQSKFAGLTPFTSQNKNRDWKISEDQFASLSKGEFPDFEFEGGITYEGKKIDPQDFMKIEAKLLIEFKNDPKKMERMGRMRENLRQALKGDDKNTLVIAFTGEDHAMDYFLKGQNEGAPTYVATPVSSRTKQFNEDHVKLMNVFFQMSLKLQDTDAKKAAVRSLLEKMQIEHEHGKNFSAMHALGPFMELAYYVHSEKKQFQPKELLKDQPAAETRKVLVGDLHGINEPAFITALPSPNCLKQMGIDSVQLHLETFRHKKDGYKEEEVESYLKGNMKATLSGTISNMLKNEKDPSRQKLMTDALAEIDGIKEPSIRPIDHALLKKVREYKEHGIKVSFQGIEP